VIARLATACAKGFPGGVDNRQLIADYPYML
jgi:hypothetical protein